jgi:hypothetical protein
MKADPRFGRRLLATAVAMGIIPTAANAAVTLLGVQYQQDNPYTEYLCLWHDRGYPTSCGADAVGANLHVYLRNDGASSVTIDDVTLAGYSLDTVIKHDEYHGHHPYSIFFYWDDPPQAIFDAGEPVWFKGDPAVIPPGGTAQAVVRLRRVPTTPTVNVDVVTSAGTLNTAIPVEADAPQLAGVGFSSDLTQVTLHWRRPGWGGAPIAVLMDGVDVTSLTTTVGDPSLDFAVSVVSLPTPLASLSYHVFQGVYPDGETATASLRTWANPFVYGSWAAFPTDGGDFDAARAWIDTCEDRGLNALMMNSASSGLVDFLKTSAGQQYAADHNYGFVIDYYGKWGCENPLWWFLDDEPDAEEANLLNNSCGTGLKLPCGSNPMGVLGRHFIAQGEALRNQANALTTINMDGSYKPHNYYAYGQLADVLMIDSYYQKRVMDSYYYYPNTQPLYEKATVIYATSLAGTTAAEPNPFCMLLYSCEANPSGYDPWPFASPETKRIEVYYALAGGARSISYWWFKPSNSSNGLGDQSDPRAQALWKEIGLLGNEIKTVQPLLVTSHPVDLPLEASNNVWVRALAAGADTLVLLVVNDDHYNDQDFHHTPVSNAVVTATLPVWMQSSPTAFEVSARGLSDVSTQFDGTDFQLSLGTLDVTRMIVVTTNPQLRATIQQRYEEQVWPGVCAFAPDYCVAQDSPPTITQDPQPIDVCAGGTATFSVLATGSGALTYQWQQNEIDLSDDGHFAGATTPMLTIYDTDETDAASYRCVVSNAYGSSASDGAPLTILPCDPACGQNQGFENGFTAGIGNGWTKFVRLGDVTCADETTETHSGAHAQEVYSQDVDNDGGVYQQFAVTAGEKYTIGAWFKCYSPQGTGIAEGALGVDPYGGTDPNSADVWWGSKPYEYWSQKTWTGTAEASHITVYLRGRSTKPADQNKTAYIWIDDVSVSPRSPTAGTPQALSPTSIRWTWTDLPGETGYRVRDTDGVDKSGLLPADTTEWIESTGITPNTQYTRHVHAFDDCRESAPSAGQTTYSLSIPPSAGSITPSSTSAGVNEAIVWTAVDGFGPGTVQYYRCAWDQEPTHTWTGSELLWLSGTMSTVPTNVGTWYFHVQGYNGDDVANGVYDDDVTAAFAATPDLDGDGDVDLSDYATFLACYNGPGAPYPIPGCYVVDFDADSDVDLADYGAFLNCYNGPARPPACVAAP